MAYGYVSDMDGDDTVMEMPTVTVTIEISQLPPAQALAIIDEGYIHDNSARTEVVEALSNDEDTPNNLPPVEFHLPIGGGLTALDAVNAIDLPEEPPEEPQV